MDRLRAMAYIVAATLFCTTARAEVMSFQSHVSEPQNIPTDRPEVISAPHKIVTIRGQKDSRIEVWFEMTYSTTNAVCNERTLSQMLAGAPKIPQTIHDYFRVPAGQTTFSVHVFLDKYAEGRCGWSPIEVGHTAFLPEESSGPIGTGGLAVIGNDGSDYVSAKYRCRQLVSLPNVKPHFYLECLSIGPSIRARVAIETEGGTVDVDMSLDTSLGHQKSHTVEPPGNGGI